MPSVCTASICSGLKYNERVNATLFYMQLLKLFTGRKINGQKMFPRALIVISGLVQGATIIVLVHAKSFDSIVKLGVGKGQIGSTDVMVFMQCSARLNMLLSVQDPWIQHHPASKTNMGITKLNYTEYWLICIFSND